MDKNEENVMRSKPKGGSKIDVVKLADIPKYNVEWDGFPDELTNAMYSFVCDGLEYDFLYNQSQEDRLFVLLSGDADRKKFTPPVFQRWSWSEYFPGHTLSISDPSLKLADDVGLAWYAGTESKEVLSTIAELILKIAQIINVPRKNIVLYASSGGAFAALQLNAIIPDVMSVVINPQIDITKYNNGKVTRFLNRFFGGISREEALNKYSERLSIIPSCQKLKNSRILYVQNKLDDHHYETQFNLFSDAIGLNEGNNYKYNNIETIFFEEPRGHRAAETTEVFQQIIKKVIEYTN